MPHACGFGRGGLIVWVCPIPHAAVFFSPADISWDQEKLVQPDLFVVPASEVTRS